MADRRKKVEQLCRKIPYLCFAGTWLSSYERPEPEPVCLQVFDAPNPLQTFWPSQQTQTKKKEGFQSEVSDIRFDSKEISHETLIWPSQLKGESPKNKTPEIRPTKSNVASSNQKAVGIRSIQ